MVGGQETTSRRIRSPKSSASTSASGDCVGEGDGEERSRSGLDSSSPTLPRVAADRSYFWATRRHRSALDRRDTSISSQLPPSAPIPPTFPLPSSPPSVVHSHPSTSPSLMTTVLLAQSSPPPSLSALPLFLGGFLFLRILFPCPLTGETHCSFLEADISRRRRVRDADSTAERFMCMCRTVDGSMSSEEEESDEAEDASSPPLPLPFPWTLEKL
mmetsp:Transcript_12755/g.37527  ORF Transcript_12755/g.37527 Transcript_12755/m.37527 type:complete len:215 (-) Transcript_12755:472-1116(-)